MNAISINSLIGQVIHHPMIVGFFNTQYQVSSDTIQRHITHTTEVMKQRVEATHNEWRDEIYAAIKFSQCLDSFQDLLISHADSQWIGATIQEAINMSEYYYEGVSDGHSFNFPEMVDRAIEKINVWVKARKDKDEADEKEMRETNPPVPNDVGWSDILLERNHETLVPGSPEWHEKMHASLKPDSYYVNLRKQQIKEEKQMSNKTLQEATVEFGEAVHKAFIKLAQNCNKITDGIQHYQVLRDAPSQAANMIGSEIERSFAKFNNRMEDIDELRTVVKEVNNQYIGQVPSINDILNNVISGAKHPGDIANAVKDIQTILKELVEPKPIPDLEINPPSESEVNGQPLTDDELQAAKTIDESWSELFGDENDITKVKEKFSNVIKDLSKRGQSLVVADRDLLYSALLNAKDSMNCLVLGEVQGPFDISANHYQLALDELETWTAQKEKELVIKQAMDGVVKKPIYSSKFPTLATTMPVTTLIQAQMRYAALYQRALKFPLFVSQSKINNAVFGNYITMAQMNETLQKFEAEILEQEAMKELRTRAAPPFFSKHSDTSEQVKDSWDHTFPPLHAIEKSVPDAGPIDYADNWGGVIPAEPDVRLAPTFAPRFCSRRRK